MSDSCVQIEVLVCVCMSEVAEWTGSADVVRVWEIISVAHMIST